MDCVEEICKLVREVIEHDVPLYIEVGTESEIDSLIQDQLDSIFEQIEFDVSTYRKDLIDKLMNEDEDEEEDE